MKKKYTYMLLTTFFDGSTLYDKGSIIEVPYILPEKVANLIDETPGEKKGEKCKKNLKEKSQEEEQPNEKTPEEIAKQEQIVNDFFDKNK
jgi:hypothetical protein